jgi:hypothetical protein
MNDWFVGAMHVAVIVFSCFFGWIMAHDSVSTECKKLGAFYVGSTVYECKEKK